MRQLFVIWHRYIGLVMTLFLLVAGVTGTMLAFYGELEALLHPHIMRITPASGQQLIDPIALAEQVEQRYPHAVLNRIPLHYESGKPMRYFLQPLPSASAESLQNNEIFIDPYTGAVLAERKWGDISQGLINLLPFIYRLHFSLAVDKWGRTLFGIIALMWTLDCLVGAYLTFPPRQVSARSRPGGAVTGGMVSAMANWCRRWKKAWQVRWGSGFYKVSFDLHRAGGLWVWAMLFVFAWSGVAFNLAEVYRPVMTQLFASQQTESELAAIQPAPALPGLNRQQALARGQLLMQQASADKKFAIRFENRLTYLPNKGIYSYAVNSSLDVSDEVANTRVMFDAQDGRLLAYYYPSSVASGNTVTEWLLALHTARMGGVPMQVFVSLMGMTVVGLSLTGVYLWWRKRKAKMAAKGQVSRLQKSAVTAAG
ncbi:PepSY-associated TM helix domain-containing protein [Methylophilus luteus]|uniref:PepSY-associated TM helix domain-containing protein n=1 Tax=Methylophilus luteus TaxID=640108 RepID=A0ABW3F2E7_9PROT